MPNRYLRWDDPNFVHNDPDGDPCEGDCITLADDYGSLSLTSMTWPREVWEKLAEHILWEKARREEEAAKQPKRWFVCRTGPHNKWTADTAISWGSNPAMGVDPDGSIDHIYVMASSSQEAEIKAQEAELAFRVFAREYLACD